MNIISWLSSLSMYTVGPPLSQWLFSLSTLKYLKEKSSFFRVSSLNILILKLSCFEGSLYQSVPSTILSTSSLLHLRSMSLIILSVISNISFLVRFVFSVISLMKILCINKKHISNAYSFNSPRSIPLPSILIACIFFILLKNPFSMVISSPLINIHNL